MSNWLLDAVGQKDNLRPSASDTRRNNFRFAGGGSDAVSFRHWTLMFIVSDLYSSIFVTEHGDTYRTSSLFVLRRQGMLYFDVIPYGEKISIRTCENSIQKWQHCITRYSSCSVISCFVLLIVNAIVFQFT